MGGFSASALRYGNSRRSWRAQPVASVAAAPRSPRPITAALAAAEWQYKSSWNYWCVVHGRVADNPGIICDDRRKE